MSSKKNQIWIWVKPDAEASLAVAKSLAKELEKKGAEVRVGGNPEARESWAVSIGGDGTFLSMVRRLGEGRFQTKVLGIHGSRGIGFLTTCKIPPETELAAWSKMLAGKILAEDGALRNHYGLAGQVFSGKKGGAKLWALNDIVIGRTALSRMLSLKLLANGEVLYEKLKGDGIIFSSALGSTAYALSAGGPIVDPDLNVIQMTPICPHPSPQRPMLFSGGAALKSESFFIYFIKK
jgi:NAD+ kinase